MDPEVFGFTIQGKARAMTGMKVKCGIGFKSLKEAERKSFRQKQWMGNGLEESNNGG